MKKQTTKKVTKEKVERTLRVFLRYMWKERKVARVTRSTFNEKEMKGKTLPLSVIQIAEDSLNNDSIEAICTHRETKTELREDGDGGLNFVEIASPEYHYYEDGKLVKVKHQWFPYEKGEKIKWDNSWVEEKPTKGKLFYYQVIYFNGEEDFSNKQVLYSNIFKKEMEVNTTDDKVYWEFELPDDFKQEDYQPYFTFIKLPSDMISYEPKRRSLNLYYITQMVLVPLKKGKKPIEGQLMNYEEILSVQDDFSYKLGNGKWKNSFE